MESFKLVFQNETELPEKNDAPWFFAKDKRSYLNNANLLYSYYGNC